MAAVQMAKSTLLSTREINFDENGQQIKSTLSATLNGQSSGNGTPIKPVAAFSSRSRKSKSEALSKMAVMPDDDEFLIKQRPKTVAPVVVAVPDMPGPKNNPARQFLSRPRAAPVEFSEVCPEPTVELPNRSENRLFGLEHCPVYYPDEAEFADPLKYIESIMENCAQDYGIVKVVPPADWKPTFALNSETFRFKTRLQRLNSMEASARSSLTFLEQLAVFHRQQKGPKATIPIIEDQTVDLWRLRKTVNELGGYRRVSMERRWPSVARTIGFDPKASPAVTSIIKQAYAKIVMPFEHYLDKVEMINITPLPGSGQSKSEEPSMHSMASRMSGGASSAAISNDINEQIQTASDRLNDVLNGGELNGESAEASLTSPTNTKRLLEPGEVCEVCHKDHDVRHIILCDDCDRGYHMACLTPPLLRVPTGDWVCDGCVVSTGADFGFETGQEHTLLSYSKKAAEFKRLWLENHPLPPDSGVETPNLADEQARSKQMAMEKHIESEFWRLVESQTETVEVEYGADLHSSKYGSGFPSLERDALDPYARDGWNLNNLPLLSGSLLRYIKSDIAGMTNPWLYAGMCFSTFAWHKEDHYTYSINYHHFGDTKTWYGVPAEDDYKLEAAMKKAAPELFAQQPDLMFQLVTLLSPGSLVKEGVRVAACDQRAGEFIITFPKSYHAGFNHGFNVNEAVNFSLPDWLEHGLACVQHYRELAKLPVFSHDELVCNIFLYEKNGRTSRWLLPYFKEMVDREMECRQQFRKSHPDVEQAIGSANAVNDDSMQCVKCRCFCYLSQVHPTAAPGRTACQDHAIEVFGNVKLTMRLRFSDSDLHVFLKRIKARADKPSLHVVEEPAEARKSTRQRIPTIAALEALGEDAAPLSERKKRSRGEMLDQSQSSKRPRQSEGAGERQSFEVQLFVETPYAETELLQQEEIGDFDNFYARSFPNTQDLDFENAM